MILIYGAVFLVWLYFWVRGNLWAAFPMAIFPIALERLTYADEKHLDPSGALAELASIFVAAFIPYLTRRYRAARMDRALNGLRLRDVD